MRKQNLLIIVLCIVLGLVILWFIRGCGGLTDSTEHGTVQKDTLWYKSSIIYNLDVEVFNDSDGDGVGDFQGLIQRIGYLDSLGVDAIWLAPFQPTPNGDDGYDVMDYYAIDERLGDLEDFEEFIQKADELDIRVLMDLVINHSSIEHPWFQEARRDKDSPYRDWYIWSEERPENQNRGMVFPGVQEEIWTYDEMAGEYYYHRFYKFQPDLNNQNPEVQQEAKKIIKTWVDRGLSGFRLDAVPFILEIPQKEGEIFEHDFAILRDLRQYVDQMEGDVIILGEANVKPEENEDYFVEDEGLHMMFNFFVNQRMFYALASADLDPLKDALRRTGGIPETAEWAQFLRNHDEVDLDRLTEEQIKTAYDEFGPKDHMQIYGRGIRRRLAPMLSNDRQRIELAHSLMFSLPSSPVIRYGSEIGMGDDLSLQERLSVRTPMQWDDTRNAGFTESRKAVRPVIDFGEYSYEKVNVADQKADSTSLLQWMTEMIDLRKSSPEISYGNWEILDVEPEEVLVMFYSWNDRRLLTIHNLSEKPRTLNLDPGELNSNRLFNRLTSEAVIPRDDQFQIPLEGNGYRWFKVE